MLWLAVLLIVCGWFLRRQGKRLEAAAYRMPNCAPTRTNRDEEPK